MNPVLTPTYFKKEAVLEHPALGKYATVWTRGKLTVLRSVATMRDGTKWFHVSVSTRDRHPTWEEMALVKDQFLGTDTEAIMVLPPRQHHVNVQSHCFHWWGLAESSPSYRTEGFAMQLPGLHKITWEGAI